MYTIYLTTRCNFKCLYCYENYSTKIDITKSIMIDAIDFIMRHSGNKVNIGFMGGEPLLLKNILVDAVEYIKENYSHKQVEYYMTTNCSLINNDIIRFLKTNNFHLRLSFDGDIKTNQLNRVSKDKRINHKTILENIIRMKEQNIDFIIRMTVTKNTLNYLYNNVIFLHNLSFDNMSICLDFTCDYSEEELFTFNIQLNNIKDYYLNEMKKNNKFTIDLFDGKIFNVLCNFGNCFSMCSAGVSSFNIMPNGDIYPCSFVTNNKDFYLGNIYDDTLKGDMYKINSSLVNKNIDKECKSCKIKDFCHGMKCGYLNYVQTGYINSPGKDICMTEKIMFDVVKEIVINIAKYNPEKLTPYVEYIRNNGFNTSEFYDSYIKSLL